MTLTLKKDMSYDVRVETRCQGNKDVSNFWGPNSACVEAMLYKVGFRRVERVGDVRHDKPIVPVRHIGEGPGKDDSRRPAGGLDTIPFVGQPTIPNTDYIVQVSTPEWRHFNGTGLLVLGHDENFFEWASANIVIVNLGLIFRPTDRMRAEFTYAWQQIDRRSDGQPSSKPCRALARRKRCAISWAHVPSPVIRRPNPAS